MFSSGSSNRKGRRPIISGDPTRGSTIDDRLYTQDEINNNKRISPYNHPFRHPLVTPVHQLDPKSDEGWSERNSFFNNLSESFVNNVLKYEKCMSPTEIKTNLTQHFNISPTADRDVLESAVRRIAAHSKVRAFDNGSGDTTIHYIGDGIKDE